MAEKYNESNRPDADMMDLLKRKLPQKSFDEFRDFVSSIGHISFLRPNPADKPSQKWVIFQEDTVEKARTAARSAAEVRGVSWVSTAVALRGAAADLRIVDSFDRAMGIVSYTVRTSVSGASKDVITDLIAATTLKAGLILVGDHDFKDRKSRERGINERFEATCMGYGVAAYTNGKLYAYCKKPAQKILRK
ncbi:MAG: hypothetical protein KGI06_00170 [Candidatus Micrarchaeota archaeon]|nr:hypothetical protein [Candidatus Micrarchaeota archaeon]